MSANSSTTTLDHDEIREWVESRGGRPSTVKSTEKNGEAGILRIDFPGYSGEDTLEEISWDDFFDKFEESGLAFVYQDTKASGEPSTFSRLVKRTPEMESERGKSKSGHSTKSKAKGHDAGGKKESGGVEVEVELLVDLDEEPGTKPSHGKHETSHAKASHDKSESHGKSESSHAKTSHGKGESHDKDESHSKSGSHDKHEPSHAKTSHGKSESHDKDESHSKSGSHDKHEPSHAKTSHGKGESHDKDESHSKTKSSHNK